MPEPAELEKSPSKYIIHLEPGIHSFPGSNLLGVPSGEEVKQKFESGDLTAHKWNPQVAQRMKQYSPLVLGLDSVPGLAVPDFRHWEWLPASPHDMSGRDSMYLIGGDLLHWQYMDDPEFYELGWSKVADYVKKGSAEGISNLIVASVSIAALRYYQEKFSRRRFLKGGLAALGAAAAGLFLGKSAPVIQSYSPSSSTEGLSQVVTDLTKPWFSESKWLDGRTALIIAKTLEAMEILDLPTGTQASVVLGYPHLYEAGRLLTNKEFRKKTIREFAQEFFEETKDLTTGDRADWEKDEELMEELIRDYGGIDGWVKFSIFTSFASSTISQITQPQSLTVKNPASTVAGLFKEIKIFESPEVKEALLPLGYSDKVSEDILEFDQSLQERSAKK